MLRNVRQGECNSGAIYFPHTHRCPPRSFVPALCKIFMDKDAPDNVLEVTARAITYYLDVSVDCTRRITAVDGALKAIITRMKTSDMSSRTSKDLAEQCVKVWFVCGLCV